MSELTVITHKGAWGKYDGESGIESALRIIAEKFSQEGEWADKYGTNVDNETFMMRPFCWCDSDDCGWCNGG